MHNPRSEVECLKIQYQHYALYIFSIFIIIIASQSERMSTIEKFYWEMTIFHTRLQLRYIKEKRETGKACFLLDEEFVIDLSSHFATAS